MDSLSLLKKTAIFILCAAVTISAVFLAAKYLLPAVLPLLIAALISAVIRKPVKFIHQKLKLPEKFAAFLLVLIITALLSGIIGFLVFRFGSEIVSLTDSAGTFIERLKNDRAFAEDMIEKVSSLFPFWDIRPKLTELWLNIDESLEALLMNLVEKLSVSVIPMITGAVTFVPDALFFIVVTVFSAYYISVGGAKMKRDFILLLPDGMASKLDKLFFALKNTALSFARAYMLIMAITFTELFVMFSAVGIRYAFLVALFTAFVDLLPVLGTGTVLIPWAIFLFICGNTKTGIAIIVIYAVITLVRQFIEPRIVGSSVGISPFASLASMYVGLKLFGAVGLFICPLAVIALQNMTERRLKNDNSQKNSCNPT